MPLRSRHAGAAQQHQVNASLSPLTDSGLYLDQCRSATPDPLFGSLITEIAREAGVERRTLMVRVLLQLPRISSWKGWVSERRIRRQIHICAWRLRKDVNAAADCVPVDAFALPQLKFESITGHLAQPVLSHLHYLGSARQGSRFFSMVDPAQGLPVALCSVSVLHWARVASQLDRQFRIPRERVLDVSRVFAVDSAPANSISTLLSHVRTWVRRNDPSIELLITAVDRNLGFTGASYRAANWKPWMMIKARPYLYDNRLYITPRQLRERFGTSKFEELQARFPGRFERSKSQLLDSVIYCCRVNGETEVIPPNELRLLNR